MVIDEMKKIECCVQPGAGMLPGPAASSRIWLICMTVDIVPNPSPATIASLVELIAPDPSSPKMFNPLEAFLSSRQYLHRR